MSLKNSSLLLKPQCLLFFCGRVVDFWRKPYALVSDIIIGYIIITVHEVVYKPLSEQSSERVPSGPSLYSFHWHSRVKMTKDDKGYK